MQMAFSGISDSEFLTQGGDGLIATATAFLKKWEPSFTGLPSSTKGWDGKITLPNSETDAAENSEEGVAANAKFKVGDKVHSVSGQKMSGTVIKVWKDAFGTSYRMEDSPDSPGSGGEWESPEKNLAIGWNSAACNAVKPGDKVKVTDGPFNGADGVVEKVDGFNVTVDLGGGLKTKVAMGNVKALNSTACNDLIKDRVGAVIGAKVKAVDGRTGVIATKPSEGNGWMWEIRTDDGKFVRYPGRALTVVNNDGMEVAENSNLTKQDIESQKKKWHDLLNQVLFGVALVRDDALTNGGAAYSLMKLIRQARDIIPSV